MKQLLLLLTLFVFKQNSLKMYSNLDKGETPSLVLTKQHFFLNKNYSFWVNYFVSYHRKNSLKIRVSGCIALLKIELKTLVFTLIQNFKLFLYVWHGTIFMIKILLSFALLKYRYNPTQLKYIIVKYLLHESEYPCKMAVHLLMHS